MKLLLRFSIALGLSFASAMGMSAQADTDHTPRDHDRLHPGIASPRRLVISVVDSTRTVTLDPETVAVLPLAGESRIQEEWSGHLLQHGAMMLSHASGASSSAVQDGWTREGESYTKKIVR